MQHDFIPMLTITCFNVSVFHYRTAFHIDDTDDLLQNSIFETEVLLAVGYRLGVTDEKNQLRFVLDLLY